MQSVKRAVALAAAILAAAAANGQPPPASAAATSEASPGAVTRPASMSSSIVTVEDLLALEGAIARKSIQKARVEAGLAAPEMAAGPVQPKGPAPQRARVESIVGVGESLRATLTVDGSTHANVRPGQRVGSCEVDAIANRCVSFRPAPVTSKGAARTACPTACWTGESPAPLLAQFGPGAPIPPGHPLPSSMPSPGMQYAAPQPIPVQGQPLAAQPTQPRP